MPDTIGATLDAEQPEEQHGFRAHERIEERLLTTNLVLDKTLSLDVPVWIVSVDLSKAFDKVKWESLWEALSEHGMFDHMLSVLQCMYYGQGGLSPTVLMEICFVSGEACDKDVY